MTSYVVMYFLLVVLVLLVAILYVIYKPPSLVFRYFGSRWPDVVWRVKTANKSIALTIDDGPSEYTETILRILEANDAKATFFVIGANISGHEQILKELVSSGCELGNHAMFDEAARSLPLVELQRQIDCTQELLDKIYSQIGPEGMAPRYFRPGHGFFSNGMRRMLQRTDFRLILGNIYPHDPQIPFWRINAWHILSMAEPGSIIICHDCRSWTIPMLKVVLPELKRRGYEVVTVSQLLENSIK